MINLETTPIAELPVMDWAALARNRAAVSSELEPAFLASGAAEPNFQRLMQGALCITTGQQPGLFTGPLFTLYKALSAIELAGAAEAALGKPVVPVFWVAGDDHDFAEANHCFVLDAQGEVQNITLRERDSAALLTPLYKELLGTEVIAASDELRAALPESEFKENVLTWLGRHYRPDADFASAFGGAIAELLGPYGLVVFYANHGTAKRVMRPLLERALAGAAELDQALAQRAEELRASGREVLVNVGDGATPVMFEGKLGRDRLVRRGGRFATRRSGEEWDLTQLSAQLSADPSRFSPNVLLRPVVEAAVLPTMAYVGGPGELAYLEQADPLYQALKVTPQARVPRWSARFVEPRVQRALEKWGISAADLATEGSRVEANLLRQELPDGAEAAFETLRSNLEQGYAKVLQAAVEVDPTLQKPVESVRTSALAGMADIEKRLLGHLKKKNETATQQLSRARNSLFPRGEPQERVVGSVTFLARYGTVFLNEADAAVRRWSSSLEPAHRGS